MDDSAQRRGHGFTICLFAMIVLVVVFLVWLGSSFYRGIVDAQGSDSSARTVLALVASDVAASDATDAIRVDDGPEGDMLVISETVGDASYETRLYIHEGYLYEEYVAADTPVDPTEATRLVQESGFQLALSSDGLLHVTTSEGSEYLYVRSTVRDDVRDMSTTSVSASASSSASSSASTEVGGR